MSDYLIWATEKLIHKKLPEDCWLNEKIWDYASAYFTLGFADLSGEYSVESYLKEVGR